MQGGHKYAVWVSVWEKGGEIEFTNFDKSTIFQQPDNTVLVTTDTPSRGSDVWLVLGKLLKKINVYQGLKFETSVTSSSSSVSHSHPLESPLSDSLLSSSSEAESKSDVCTHTHTLHCSMQSALPDHSHPGLNITTLWSRLILAHTKLTRP